MSDQPFPPRRAQDQGRPQAGYPRPIEPGYPGPTPTSYPGSAQPGYPPPGGPPGRPPGAYGPGPGGPGGPGGPAPRRRSGALVVVLIVVVALVVGGAAFVVASGGDDGAEPEVRNDLTLAELDPALLAAADLPETFTEVTWGADSGDELSPDDMDASEECTEALRRFAVNDGDEQETGSEFDSVDGATMTHTLSLVQADDPPIGDVRDAVGSCGTFGYDDGEDAGQITLEATSVDGIGDEALGISMLVETESQGTPVSVEMYGILVDRDGIHSSVRATGALPPDYQPGDSIVSDPADRDLVRQAAEAIDAKVENVVAG
ncbi:MAG TPA: hypothetical protein VK306_12075 [Acidimicrobiales bacterium]|nr:hypothetical protein [Acidimicrobiales bacterium]